MKEIIVGMSTCGLSAGAQQLYDRLDELAGGNPGSFTLSGTGCIGMCYREPLVEVREDGDRVIYGQVTAELVDQIYSKHVIGGEVLEEHVALRIAPDGKKSGSEAEFHKLQTRIVLRNCGTIDPE